MVKTLLDVKKEEITVEQMLELRKQGKKVTPATLYEPEHAPKGTKFVMVKFGKDDYKPYRIWI